MRIPSPHINPKFLLSGLCSSSSPAVTGRERVRGGKVQLPPKMRCFYLLIFWFTGCRGVDAGAGFQPVLVLWLEVLQRPTYDQDEIDTWKREKKREKKKREKPSEKPHHVAQAHLGEQKGSEKSLSLTMGTCWGGRGRPIWDQSLLATSPRWRWPEAGTNHPVPNAERN